MTDETREQVEDLLRAHFAEHDQVPPLAVESAKALFGLRRIDEELIELMDGELALRGDDGPDVLRFERGDVVLIVRRRPGVAEIIVSPPSTPVAVESADGAVALETDEEGVATLTQRGPVRFRLELPDGTSGVTDGIDLSPA